MIRDDFLLRNSRVGFLGSCQTLEFGDLSTYRYSQYFPLRIETLQSLYLGNMIPVVHRTRRLDTTTINQRRIKFHCLKASTSDFVHREKAEGRKIL